MSSTAQIPLPAPSVDPYEYLQISPNSDGTMTRKYSFPTIPATPDPTHPAPVLSKDVPINQSKPTWARIFLPRDALDNSSKLPLVVYYHAGGFILWSASISLFHDYCSKMAEETRAVVVSVDYRLAPEHRLPAAYEDALEALHWIRTTEEEWIREYADVSNCFVMGGSAGGNIAYHVGLRAADGFDDHDPQQLKIRGLILHHPYFGGVQRSASEMRLAKDRIFPLNVNDLMWEFALPVGADRDHEYCNPTVGGGSRALEKIRRLGWKVVVYGCYGDPLVDRQMEVAAMMEAIGVEVVARFSEGGFHWVEGFDRHRSTVMNSFLKDIFWSSN